MIKEAFENNEAAIQQFCKNDFLWDGAESLQMSDRSLSTGASHGLPGPWGGCAVPVHLQLVYSGLHQTAHRGDIN